MQVERQLCIDCESEKELNGTTRVWVEVRTPSDDIDTG
jgi:hypothetical protein